MISGCLRRVLQQILVTKVEKRDERVIAVGISIDSLLCHGLPTEPDTDAGTILVTGASGYIGGRLVPELTARGYNVRVMVRRYPSEYKALWPGCEVVVADALDMEALRGALEGVSLAYYLIHSMLLGREEFARADIRAASNFRRAAEERNIRRIIYLGGLGDVAKGLSKHLRSRIEVSEELCSGSVKVTVLRAAVIIGSGSASYEIMGNLVKKLPVIPEPRAAKSLCQPISIRDIVKYLVAVLEIEETSGKMFDVGGSEVMSYSEMLRKTAAVLGVKRVFVPVSFFSIGGYSYITSLLTPVPGPITRCLMEGLKNDVVCRENRIKEYVDFPMVGFEEAIERAIAKEKKDRVKTRWSNAYYPSKKLLPKLDDLKEAPQYKAFASLVTGKDAAKLFSSICAVGGPEGWFHGNWLWRLRGAIDRILLGVGTSRGRRKMSHLKVNDVVGFWRVEDLKVNRRLLLRSELKLPGNAWLEFNISEKEDSRELSITAWYYTGSVLGKLYWYFFLPFHHFIFKGLIEQIEERS